MKKKIISRFAIVCLLASIATLFCIPSSFWGDGFLGKRFNNHKITLGLDLAGGTELDYRIDLSDAIAQNNDDDPQNNVSLNSIAESVRDALEKRVNPAGVGEIIVKRSQVNNEEHILIQMPPSENIQKAKDNAEQDNRLEFFEEDPLLKKEKEQEINKIRENLNSYNWKSEAEKLAKNTEIEYQTYEERYKDSISDTELTEKLFSAKRGEILNELIQTQTEPAYTIENGEVQILEMPKQILAIVYVKDKKTKSREKTTPAEVEARHILFAYPGAMRAGEDVKYKSETEAKKEATELLEKLKNEGTENFAELAKEYSTETAAQTSGGNLGRFSKGKMAAPFEEACFGAESTGLLPELVKTDFGYHIIEVQNIFPEETTTTNEEAIDYEILGWNTDELGWEITKLNGALLENASVGYSEIGQPTVDLLFNEEGGDLFAELTGKIAQQKCDGSACRLGIKVGGKWYTKPTVTKKIVGRRCQITGQFTFDSAKALADGLNLGAIDAPVRISGQTTIEPVLGQNQLNKSLQAGALGLFATILFMIFNYRLAGVVAGFSLLIYTGLFVTLLKLWPTSFGGPIVLTLSGIAGLVLSVGLAVDGNILIFERMKEEIKNGHTLHQALDYGFERAWVAIRDSNLTTLITCFILFNLGSSMIKGFAITLIVGTLLSMFTAITISRNILHFILLWKPFQKMWLFGIKKKDLK